MAQTGFTPIQLYSTSTAAAAPSASNLTNSTLGSELAINITDGKLFYKDNANAVQVIGWKIVPTTAGGTGLTTYTAGDMLFYTSGTALSQLAIGTSGRYLSSTGSAPQWSAPAALTRTDDTNVTLTLGGSASTALLNAASLTLGWTGTLAVGRGGTGLSTLTAGYIPFGNGTSAFGSSASFVWDNGNGRLGVGTASPGTILDVQSATSAIRNTSTTGTNQVFIRQGNTGGFFYTGLDTNAGGFLTGSAYAAFHWNSANSPMIFATNNAEFMRIFASGGVSIGNTTDPGAANLSVSGTVTAGLVGRQATYTPGATTPSVTGCTFIGISNSSATTITNFTGGVTGQILTCYFLDSNTTVNRSNAYLNGGNNFVSTSNDTLVLLHVSGFWYEISRSNNS
jgi:hypothetical protein